MNTVNTSEQAVRRLQEFIVQYALPLWATAGFDEATGCFHERLEYSGEPRDAPRRLLVQARQIVVYSRAALNGWTSQGKALALMAFENVCRHYRSRDKNAGWIFSVDFSSGLAKDETCDLYTHAFVIYMLAWLYRLDGNSSILTIADDTLSVVDRIFACGSQPGLLSKIPGPTNLREQNPHMHLFEALLALAEASGMERYLTRANAIVDLFDLALVDRATGTVREIFDEDWKPVRAVGENLVEPGHQMEWAWLLREWERITGAPTGETVSRLIAHAVTFGIDRQRSLVRNVVQEDGTIVNAASRVWPQTEAIRALCREDASGEMWPNLVPDITNGLFQSHLPARLSGGWIDQIDQAGVPTVDYMPASTLYHLVGAAIDASEKVSQFGAAIDAQAMR